MKLFYSSFLVFLLVSAGWSQNFKDLITAEARTEKSAEVIRQFAAPGADSVPAEYFQKAKAVAVFPGLTKVSILFSELIIGSGLVSLDSDNSKLVL
jgi:lipid-binding SYLF domain-containing protein